MLHFAWTGKREIGGKSVTALTLTKVKGPLMSDLMDSLLKAVLPNFSTVGSTESLVDKLHSFLEKGNSAEESQKETTGRSSGRASGQDSIDDDKKLKALVFFATEGLGMDKMSEGDSIKMFGSKLKQFLERLNQLLGFVC